MGTLNNALRNMIARGVLETVDDNKGVQVMGLALLAGERKSNVERFQNYGFSSVPVGESEAIVIFPGGDRSAGVIIAMDERGARMTGLAPGEVGIYSNSGNSILMRLDGTIEVTSPNKVTVLATEDVTVTAKRMQVDVEEDILVNAKTAVVNTEETVTVNAKGDVTVNTEANAALNVQGDVTVAADGNAVVSANTARVDLQGNMAVIAPGGVLIDTPLLACTGEIQDALSSMSLIRNTYNIHTHPNVMNGPGTAPPTTEQLP